ncbi:MAG TPA: hypothetical protein PLQ13_07545 [Candidatus Krumholzibacteria bacterium]|nr:hypothetical protein [Candidatus Krumholzibacteria bacterium]
MILRRPTLMPALALVLAAGAACAGPLYWDWPRGESFTGCVLDGAALDAAGRVTAGLAAAPLGEPGPEVVWCAVADGKGGFYTGSGHGGEIRHVDADGRARTLVQLEAAEVFSLLPRSGGGVLAGCGPEGELVQVGADGAPRALGRVPGGYVWALLEGADGTVWAATGSPAQVWRLGNDGAFALAVDLPAQNALDLAWDREGRLLVATQGPGLVYRVDPRHLDRPSLLMETEQGEARQFIAGPGGDLYVLALESGDDEESSGRPRAGANGSGNGNGGGSGGLMHDLMIDVGPPPAALYRLRADGRCEPYWIGDSDLMIAAWTERWGWLGGAVRDEDHQRAGVLQLTPPAGMQPLAGWAGGDVMFLLPDPARGRVVACEAHPGGLTMLSEAKSAARSALSRPVDAGRSVAWGRLRWDGDTAAGTPRWSVRTGNRAEPDVDWSDWIELGTGNDLAIAAPAGRYLQWRVTFPAAAAAGACAVDAVSVSAWRDNLPPAVAAFGQEQVGDILAGGLMPRGDNVTQVFKSGLRAEYSRTSGRDPSATDTRAAATRAVRTFTWRGADPDGDRLVYDLEFRRRGEAAWRPVLMNTPETIGAWDTSGLPDGTYEVRLTATDSPDNPADQAARTARVLGPVAVDNTPPQVSRLNAERTAAGLRLRFRAEDAGGVLAGASVVLPDGTRERLDPTDRVCDSAREDFDREIAWPREGGAAGGDAWPVRVEVRDLGGNLGFADVEVAR